MEGSRRPESDSLNTGCRVLRALHAVFCFFCSPSSSSVQPGIVPDKGVSVYGAGVLYIYATYGVSPSYAIVITVLSTDCLVLRRIGIGHLVNKLVSSPSRSPCFPTVHQSRGTSAATHGVTKEPRSASQTD